MTSPPSPKRSFPRLLFLLERFDESFALLSFFLERHYLHKGDALLAESLYGFRRACYPAPPVGSNADESSGNSSRGSMAPLTAADRRRALAYTVLAPYVKAKLDALYSKWSVSLPLPPARRGRRRRSAPDPGEEEEEEQEETSIRLRRAFVAMYPLLHTAYEGSFFVYQWAYLLGRSAYYSPLLHLAGQALRRVTREDLVGDRRGRRQLC